MVCTRGVPPPGSRDPRLATNRFYAYALPFVWIAPPEKQREGIDLFISQRQRIAPGSVDPTVKNYHWLDLVQSLFDAYDRGADTSCVVDAAGNITEGPGFNVFVVRDGVVSTADRGVLEGISRRTVIELCEPARHPASPARRYRPRNLPRPTRSSSARPAAACCRSRGSTASRSARSPARSPRGCTTRTGHCTTNRAFESRSGTRPSRRASGAGAGPLPLSRPDSAACLRPAARRPGRAACLRPADA